IFKLMKMLSTHASMRGVLTGARGRPGALASRHADDNGRGAWSYGNPLGVECNGCSHRGLVALERIGASDGDMRPLLDRPFKGSACDSMFVGLWLFATRAEVVS